MYGMLTRIVVKPGKRSELLEYLRWDAKVAKASEPGTWRFDVWEAEPGVVYLYEAYKDRAAFEARALLRRAAFEPPGPKRLVAHPAVASVIEDRRDWLDALAGQTGGAISLRADPALPMSGGYAESC